jgi:SSS family solute:Na+ symporter
MSTLIPFFIILAISIYASKKAARMPDFFLANRSLSTFLLTMTLLGTQIGGGFMLGTSDAAYNSGPCGIFYSLGLSIGLLILGLGYAGKLRSFLVKTVPELLKVRYGSQGLASMAAGLSIISLGGITVAQGIALKKFFLSMGFDSILPYAITWGVVAAYTTWGGFLAVVWTDTIQALVMLALLTVAFCGLLFPEFEVVRKTCQDSSWSFDMSFLPMLLMPALFMCIEQDIAQRCFAAKSPQTAKRACFISAGIIALFAGIPTLFGMAAKEMGISSEGSVFMNVIRSSSWSFLGPIAETAILLAIISTTSSLLLAVSSNISEDLVKGKASDRWITALVGAIAFLLSLTGSNILNWIISSYEISVAGLLIPTAFAVLSPKEKKLDPRAGLFSFLGGIIGYVLSKLLIPEMYQPFAYLSLSLITYYIGLPKYKKVQIYE